MIQCPYCLKEISKFAIQCPHCGKNLNDSNIDYFAVLAENQEKKEDKQKYREEQAYNAFKKVGIFMLIILLVIAILAGVFMIYSKIQIPRARQFADEGEYQKAYNILKTTLKNDAAQELLTEIRNESYILSAREATIERIKNDEGNFFQNGDYYSFCVYTPSLDKYTSWGICPYSNKDHFYDNNKFAEDVKMACRNITGYEPQNEPLESTFDATRLSNMCYSNKKIDVLE